MSRKKQKEFNDEKSFYASSATECTGLISVPPQSEDELESYKEIYNYGSPLADKE